MYWKAHGLRKLREKELLAPSFMMGDKRETNKKEGVYALLRGLVLRKNPEKYLI